VRERERFLRAIEANPGDNTALVAYAECLEQSARRPRGGIRDARKARSIRGFLGFSGQLAALLRGKQNPAEDPSVTKLIATEQWLRRKLLTELLSKPGEPPADGNENGPRMFL
jgi:uncharacterized protein (TIGR02996 family)